MIRRRAWLHALLAVALWAAAPAGLRAEVDGLPAVVADPAVRPAQVAGSFYLAEAGALRKAVTELLQLQPAVEFPAPSILIAPHAGYGFSGPVAAAAFRQVQGRRYDAVVVIGFTHQQRFLGTSVDDRVSYQTPLGAIPVDQSAVELLRGWGVGHREDAHASAEHSLEVMLPFLQVALGEFRLVPLLMGSDAVEDARALATALAALSRRGNYLFVFSTDLSHYHPYQVAVRLDELTVNVLLSETAAATSRLFGNGQLEACGRGPLLAALSLAERLGYPERRLLAYANSGDTAGDRNRVVGYAAIGMASRPPTTEFRLSPEAGQAMVRAARLAIDTHLRRVEPKPDLGLAAHPELQATRGLFVTLRKAGQLRGCIGRIVADAPMAALLPKVALDAALNDSRFPPVTAEELDALHVEVSVLTPPTTVQPDDITAGRDGVVLQRDGHGGVFLPQVWHDTGWTRVEFLRELASQKAGLAPDDWQNAHLAAFQDQVFAEPSSPAIAH